MYRGTDYVLDCENKKKKIFPWLKSSCNLGGHGHLKLLTISTASYINPQWDFKNKQGN